MAPSSFVVRRRRSALAALPALAVAGCGSTVSPATHAGASAADSALGGTAAGTTTGVVGTDGGAPAGIAGADLVGGGSGAATDAPVATLAGDTSRNLPTAAQASDSGAPIKIGYTIWDQTGFTAVTGNTSATDAAANQAAGEREMAALVKYANATGGVGGRKILRRSATR